MIINIRTLKALPVTKGGEQGTARLQFLNQQFFIGSITFNKKMKQHQKDESLLMIIISA